MTVERSFTAKVEAQKGPLDWLIVERLTHWLVDNLSKKVYLKIEDSDGEFSADSVSAARQHLDEVRSTVHHLFLAVGLNWPPPPVSAIVSWHYASGSTTTVSIEGTDHTAVRGLAARLQEAIDRGLLTPDEHDSLPGPTEAPEARSRLKRLLMNPWAYTIGGGLVVVLIGALLTILFR